MRAPGSLDSTSTKYAMVPSGPFSGLGPLVAQPARMSAANIVSVNVCFIVVLILFRGVKRPNVPDQRPRAAGVGIATQKQSRGSLHPVGSAIRSFGFVPPDSCLLSFCLLPGFSHFLSELIVFHLADLELFVGVQHLGLGCKAALAHQLYVEVLSVLHHPNKR